MTPMQQLIQAAKYTAMHTQGALEGRFALEAAITRAENPETCRELTTVLIGSRWQVMECVAGEWEQVGPDHGFDKEAEAETAISTLKNTQPCGWMREAAIELIEVFNHQPSQDTARIVAAILAKHAQKKQEPCDWMREAAKEITQRRGCGPHSISQNSHRELAAIIAKHSIESIPSALKSDDVSILDNALNYFYPSRSHDGDEACDARQALFELRDRLNKQEPARLSNFQPNPKPQQFQSEMPS